MQLKNKIILVISPQAWGQMYLSKHHYALTLARRGNTVYFLNPPVQGKFGRKETVHVSPLHENLFLVEHTIGFPYNLKFHFFFVFHWFMKFHIKKVLRVINQPLDIIWSFDQLHIYSFNFFDKKSFKIFQPVDEPCDENAIEAASGSDVILSVTKEILSKYRHLKKPQYLINHGIDEDFLLQPVYRADKQRIHVGFSGNLLRRDIDRDIFLQIVRENPCIVFECWGCYKTQQTNIGGTENSPSRLFIESLQRNGVILHGPVSSRELARELHRMDAFLVCYDVQKDPSKGTNYHKLMEYLSTGKVIIASNITSYQNNADLVQMVKERESNKALPALFKKVIENLNFYNSSSLILCRKDFASGNTYAKHVARIETILGEKSFQLTICNLLVNIA